MGTLTLSGVLKRPISGDVVPNARITFDAIATGNVVLKGVSSSCKTASDGSYSVDLEYGDYTIQVIDLHSRAGIQDLLWRSAPTGTEGKDWYLFYMEQMLGPTIGGIGLNFASGYDKMAKGDWLGGIQTVTPAAVKNLVKTYAEATRGVTTSSGEEIVPTDEFTHFELAAQAFGFSPSRIGQAYDARSAVKNVQSELSNRRAQLFQRYFANAMSGDDNGEVLEDIQAYNRSNPTNAITGEIILKAMRQKQKARLKKERGLALSRQDEHLRMLGRFGSYEPVL